MTYVHDTLKWALLLTALCCKATGLLGPSGELRPRLELLKQEKSGKAIIMESA